MLFKQSSPQIDTQKAYWQDTMTELWVLHEALYNSSSPRMLTRIQKGTYIYLAFLIIIFSGRWVNNGAISTSTENETPSQHLNLHVVLSHRLLDVWLASSKQRLEASWHRNFYPTLILSMADVCLELSWRWQDFIPYHCTLILLCNLQEKWVKVLNY